MQRLWIINQFANTPYGSGGTRHYSLAKYLKELDWDTSIIAGSLEHNTDFQRLERSEKIKLENINGVKFLWIKLSSYKFSSLRNRSFNMIYFFIKLIFLNLNRFIEKPNIIIGSSVTPFAALGGYLLSIKYKVPFVYEVRDIWPKSLIEMKVIKSSSLVSVVFDLIDTFLANRSSKIIVLMPGGGEYYEEKGILDNKIFWISNGVEFKKKIDFKKNTDDKVFNLTYMGSMGPSNSIETIFNSINFVNKVGDYKSKIKLKLFGSGSSKEKLIYLKNKLSLDNIYFEKPVPKRKVHKILSLSDALIFTMNNLPELYKYGISFNKIFDYLLAARPVLSTSCAQYDIINYSNSGLICKANDHINLGENIIKMIDMNESERLVYGNNGRQYVLDNFLYINLAKKLSKLLYETIKK